MSQIDELMPLVDGAVGIVRSLQKLPRGDDEPEPPVLYRAVLSNFDFVSARPMEREAVGKGLTDAAAIGGAIGEAIEHYCAAHIGLQETMRAALCGVRGPIITPNECVLFSEQQYRSGGIPFLPFDDEVTINWTRAVELPSRDIVWVPELLTYLGTTGSNPKEYFVPPDSNGLAAGPDLASAIVAGLCERAEREALLVTWLNRLPVNRIDPGDRGPAARICRQYRRFGVEVTVVALATDLPMYPMMAIALDRERAPACVVGLGCDLHPGRAALKALFEVCQLRPTLVRHVSTGADTRLEHTSVHSLEDHSIYFADPAHLHELEFLFSNPDVIPLDELADRSTGSSSGDLTLCTNALLNVGCRVAYVELTTPDLSTFPIHVVRTVATGLQPIHFGFGMERLGGRRVFELPRKLGYAARPSAESELNHCPHPMA